MSPPTLSVVMCVYNHAPYVGRALEAILIQSCPPLEVIVIDDGSTDDGAEIISRYAAREPRVRFLSNDRNRGLFCSFQKGLELARGDCVFGAASDDTVLPGLFEKALAMLERHPQAGFCSARSSLIGENDEDLGEVWVPGIATGSVYIPPARALAILDRQRGWFLGNTTIYRKRALLDEGGFIPELGSFCDGFICMVLALKHGACFIPEVLAAWRKTSGSFSSRTQADPHLSLAIMDRAGRLMRTTYSDLFPPSFVERWERRWILDLLNSLNDAHRRNVRVCAARIPGAAWADRFFVRLLLLHLAGASLLTRIRLFSKAGRVDQLRILRAKLRRASARRVSHGPPPKHTP